MLLRASRSGRKPSCATSRHEPQRRALRRQVEDDHFLELCDRTASSSMAGWCCCDHWEQWPQWDQEDQTIAPSLCAINCGVSRAIPRSSTGSTAAITRRGQHRKAVSRHHSGNRVAQPYSPPPPRSRLPSLVPRPQDERSLRVRGAFLLAARFDARRATASPPKSPRTGAAALESLRRMLPEDHLWPIDSGGTFTPAAARFGTFTYHRGPRRAVWVPSSLEDYAAKPR